MIREGHTDYARRYQASGTYRRAQRRRRNHELLMLLGVITAVLAGIWALIDLMLWILPILPTDYN